MRRRLLPAFGTLAIIFAMSLSQSVAAQQATMVVMPLQPLIWFPPMPQPPQAPQVKFRGCVYYEHANWQGKWRAIPGGTRRISVGPSWNDIISSFACNPACQAVAFTDDFKGQREQFTTTAYVGDPWNDKISSMIVACKLPW